MRISPSSSQTDSRRSNGVKVYGHMDYGKRIRRWDGALPMRGFVAGRIKRFRAEAFRK